MKNYFGKEIADRYDDDPSITDPSVIKPIVDFIADLANNTSVLEFGIGTGRIALPLSKRGVAVQGIDLSPDMVKQLQSKPGSDAIGVTIGDFSTTKVEDNFQVVFLVFNTITNLTTQKSQIECFRNAAAHLKPNGYFVIETFIPALRRLPYGETICPHQFSQSRFDFDEYNVSTQELVSHHYRNVDGAYQGHSIPFRYVWPSELDLMAQIAGMHLYERWNDWHRKPFNNESTTHVSVWQKAS